MNLFDRMLDAFSGSDLGRRAWSVVLFGCLLIAAAVWGGLSFLNSVQTISVDATGKCVDDAPGTVELQLGKGMTERIESLEGLSIEPADDKGISYPVRVRSMMSEANTVEVALGPGFACPAGRFGVKLILKQEPYWKLLWGGDH